jgi:bifunctional DNA-binding transcriptional regulator/antitoxin component of YhaV-PrlF toxin-antitoxin module
VSETFRLDPAGSLTLPPELLRRAGLEPGSELVAEVEAGRVILSPARPPIWERIAARVAQIPPEELDKLPTDGASQHDHYLYGTPKRPEPD